MSLKTTGQGIGGMLMLVVIVFTIVSIFIIIGLAWQQGFGPWAKEIERDINQNSQQYQETQVRELRNLYLGIVNGNEEHKKAFTAQFCTVYLNVKSPPDDLVLANEAICPSNR